MVARNGSIIIRMLPDVKRKTIEPIIQKHVKKQSVVNTDEYNIYNWLSNGYIHKTVNHGKKEYARDEDNDGIFEIHVNTIEGFWSLLRSWLRPHRGLSQERLHYYLAFFEYLHDIRKRGQRAIFALLYLLVA